MCRMHSWSKYNVDLWPQGQIYRIFYMFSCRAHNYFLLWYWLPLFCTWFYHHKSMCRVPSTFWYNIDLWPQDQIYMVFGMAICSNHSFFVLLRYHILFGTWVYHHWTMCNIFSWSLYDLDLWPQYQNYIFSPWICFALWHKHPTTCCVHSFIFNQTWNKESVSGGDLSLCK